MSDTVTDSAIIELFKEKFDSLRNLIQNNYTNQSEKTESLNYALSTKIDGLNASILRLSNNIDTLNETDKNQGEKIVELKANTQNFRDAFNKHAEDEKDYSQSQDKRIKDVERRLINDFKQLESAVNLFDDRIEKKITSCQIKRDKESDKTEKGTQRRIKYIATATGWVAFVVMILKFVVLK